MTRPRSDSGFERRRREAPVRCVHATPDAMVWCHAHLIDGAATTWWTVQRRAGGGRWAVTRYWSEEAAVAALEPVGVAA